MNHEPYFNNIPAKVENFMGRQDEMYDIISHLESHRLITITGVPGIGKTSIAKNIANFLKDRMIFEDGILYLSLRGCESAEMFIARLALLIKQESQ